MYDLIRTMRPALQPCLLAALLAVLAACGRRADPPAATARPGDSVTLTERQAQQVAVLPSQWRAFDRRLDAVGYIDFDQDRLAQVSSPYQGRVRQVLVQVGDRVARGQLLFTVDSADLVQAESNLVAAAGVRALASHTLERARQLLDIQANARKDLEQAIADQQTAEASYRAARTALRLLGQTDAQIDRIATRRAIDGELRVTSPIAGRVAARAVAPGDWLQQGGAAPISVAADDALWMVAGVPEDEITEIHPGDPVSVRVEALPGLVLQGRVDLVGSSVDPITHRVQVRTVLHGADARLRPQMLASMEVRTAPPARVVTVPAEAVVREGDGTMTVYVTTDGRRFTRRPVALGRQQDGQDEIGSGLAAGERVAGSGALFLSNALALQSQ